MTSQQWVVRALRSSCSSDFSSLFLVCSGFRSYTTEVTATPVEISATQLDVASFLFLSYL